MCSDSLASWAAAGDRAFAVMWHDGHGEGILADIAYVRRHRAELTRELG